MLQMIWLQTSASKFTFQSKNKDLKATCPMKSGWIRLWLRKICPFPTWQFRNKDPKACGWKFLNCWAAEANTQIVYNIFILAASTREAIVSTLMWHWRYQFQHDVKIVNTRQTFLTAPYCLWTNPNFPSLRRRGIRTRPLQKRVQSLFLSPLPQFPSKQSKVERSHRECYQRRASRLYLLRQLKRAKGDPAQLLCFYTTCIRPMSEYACQVFHNGLPEYLSEELEKIQRRALRIIFPDLDFQEALKRCNIATLHQRRQWLTERLFNEIKDNSLHKLHGLLPPRNLSTVALRRKRAFNVPLCRTNRLMNSFIMQNAAIF